MSLPSDRSPISGAVMAVAVGVMGGVLLLAIAASDSPWAARLGGPSIDRSGRLSIHLNGISQQMARDIFLPTEGWVIQLRFIDLPVRENRDGLVVMLRSERTGATIEIQDRFQFHAGETSADQITSLTVPRALGLAEGLLSVRAIYTDETGKVFEDSRRIRIRDPLGLPPISVRQVIHFDFSVDHDANGQPDFWADLERFGLASDSDPDLARQIASQVESRALARVEAAYSATHDPNRTGQPTDLVHVRFRQSDDPAALTSRICVGGADPTQRHLVGHVQFDYRNEKKTSPSCSREPAAGLFPAELMTYQEAALFREVFGPFDAERGGRAIGRDAEDSVSNLSALQERDSRGDEMSKRQRSVLRAIQTFGDVLGSIMAHEAGHALGLVPEGRPSVGLFGGHEGEDYAHNIDVAGDSEATAWLMNTGGNLTFVELAGLSADGPLRFRPLNYAYLRDRVIVSDKR